MGLDWIPEGLNNKSTYGANNEVYPILIENSFEDSLENSCCWPNCLLPPMIVTAGDQIGH